MIAIDALAHLFEATGRETALDVGSDISIVSLLVGSRSHPGLFNLEIVRHIDGAPLTVIILRVQRLLLFAGMESPSEVQVLNDALLRHSGSCTHDEQPCK